MITNYTELINEINMLQGNINRICVTDNVEEVEKMYAFAKLRLDDVYKYNLSRIKEYDILYQIGKMDLSCKGEEYEEYNRGGYGNNN